MKNKSSTKSLSLTIGSDPELMLWDTQAGKIVSSMPVLGQTKENPILLGNGVKFYADNVLAEAAFNPIDIAGDIASHFRDVWVRVQERLGDRFRLLPKAAHLYDDDQLATKLVTPNGIEVTAFDIGCTPSLDVYRRCMNMPTPFKDGTRSSSMHIHIGNANYKTDQEGALMTIESKEEAVKIMDIIVGCSSAIFDKDETAAARRELGYGRAGNFRVCEYGLEFRVLSSYALRSPILVDLVRDLTTHAMSFIIDDTVEDALALVNPDDVEAAINNSDVTLARSILKKVSMPSSLMKRVEQDYKLPSFNEAWGI